MDVGAWGHREHVPPTFQRLGHSVPFRAILVALLENFENAKMNRKMDVFGDFRRSKFHNFSASQTKRSISLPTPLPRCPSIYVPSDFYNASYVSDCKGPVIYNSGYWGGLDFRKCSKVLYLVSLLKKCQTPFRNQ